MFLIVFNFDDDYKCFNTFVLKLTVVGIIYEELNFNKVIHLQFIFTDFLKEFFFD